MTAQIIPIHAAQPVAAAVCRWSEAVETVTTSNIKVAFAWQRMWARLMLGSLVLLTTGCATDIAVLRIVEYKSGSVIAAFSGDGIAVHQSGKPHAFADVRIIYQGERGAVTVESRAAESAPADPAAAPENQPQAGK